MDKTSSLQKNAYTTSTHTHKHEERATQASNDVDVTGQFSRFNIAETDAEPKIPEAKTKDVEQSTRACTLMPANKQKKQKTMATYFVRVFSNLVEKADINPTDMETDTVIPCVKNTSFFLSISPHINVLMKKIKSYELNVDDVIKNILHKLMISNLTIEHITMCSRLLKAAKQYEEQVKQLSLFLGVSDEDNKQYIENIYKLFIEGDELYRCYNDFNANTNDNGPYVFENEIGYTANCFTAFSDTLEELLIDDEKIGLKTLDKIINIFNTSNYQNSYSYYIATFLQEYSSTTVNLLAQGKISKYLVINDTNNVSKLEKNVRTEPHITKGLLKVVRDKSLVEDYINSKLDENTFITLKQSESDPDYYVVDTIKEIKNDGTITTSTSDILAKQACIFEPIFEPQEEDLLVNSSFDEKYNPEEYIESLIATYHNETAQTQTDLEYATSLMKFAGSLQRVHIYIDCNGRMTFFNLVPILLMKRGLWVTRQPFDLWDLTDALPPEELAKKYLELCINMPKIQPNKEHDWRYSLPLSERLRIAKITGKNPLKVLSVNPENLT